MKFMLVFVIESPADDDRITALIVCNEINARTIRKQICIWLLNPLFNALMTRREQGAWGEL